MKLQSVYAPLKNYFNVVRNSFVCASKHERAYVEGGAEALAQQNKILVRSVNRVEPERVNFNSTKEMFEYAKSKVISPLQGEAPSEYTVVMNVKENKVLAEYRGDASSCSLSDLETLPLDDLNVVLMHGHPDSYPISKMDVKTLLNYTINQVIAVDKDGKFSMVARRNGIKHANLKSNEYKKFSAECDDNMDSYLDSHNKEMQKLMTHTTLSRFADSLGLRYVTNYPYLLK